MEIGECGGLFSDFEIQRSVHAFFALKKQAEACISMYKTQYSQKAVNSLSAPS